MLLCWTFFIISYSSRVLALWATILRPSQMSASDYPKKSTLLKHADRFRRSSLEVQDQLPFLKGGAAPVLVLVHLQSHLQHVLISAPNKYHALQSSAGAAHSRAPRLLQHKHSRRQRGDDPPGGPRRQVGGATKTKQCGAASSLFLHRFCFCSESNPSEQNRDGAAQTPT